MASFFNAAARQSCVVILVFTTARTALAQAPLPPPGRDETTYQLALTLKTRADQNFLLGDSDAAEKLYAEAAKELGTVGTDWKRDNSSMAALLEADISYRRTLLEYHADFWGASYSLTPINPVEAYARFDETVARLDEVVNKIAVAKEKALNAESAESVIAANRDAARTTADEAALTKIMDDIKATNHDAKATSAQARIARNIERQKQISSEREKLAKQFDAAHRTFDSLVVNSVLEATGIPPEIGNLANGDKPLEDRLLSAGRAYIASNSDVLETFKGLSDTTAQIVEAVQSVDKAAADIEQVRKSADAAATAIRKGTLEGALEAGTLIYNQLPDSDKDQLKTIVIEQSRPVVALLETVQKAGSTLEVVTDVIAQSDDMRGRLQSVLVERISQNSAGFDRWYRQRLVEMAHGQTDAMLLSEQVVRGWPSGFFARLPEDVRKTLRQAQGVEDDVAAAKKVFATWPPSDLQLVASANGVEVRIGNKSATIDIRSMAAELAAKDLEAVQVYAEDAAISGTDAAKQVMEARLKAMLDSASKDVNNVKNFAAYAHDLDASTSLARVLPPEVLAGKATDKSSELFSSIWSKLPAQAKDETSVQLAKMQAGSVLAKDVLKDPRRLPPRGSQSSVRGTSGGMANEAMLKAAVTAAFPAAGVALMAADALNSLGQMNSLIDQMNNLTREDRAIMAEQLSLFDLVRDEEAATALARVSVRISELRQAGANSQIEKFDIATNKLNTASMGQVVAQRLFMPRVYLLSEQLRFRFDQLDRSLAFWTGDPRAPRGQLARNLIDDPQSMRYALDPRIDIYKWLDRTNEADRSDLQQLTEEWQRKRELASDACDKLQCKSDTAVLGEVARSPELSLKDLLPDQWLAFKKWQSSGAGDFTFEFLLTPSMLKPSPDMQLIRFVGARAGGLAGNSVGDLAGSSLQHPGAAFVPLGDAYVKEHYLPGSVHPTWSEFPTDQRTRWTRSLALQPLEGYALYTVWRFTVQDTSASRNAHDVLLQFAFQYRSKAPALNDAYLLNSTPRSAAWKLNFTTKDGQPLRISLSDLPFFGQDESARQTVQRLLNDQASQQAGLGGVTLTEEGAVR